MNVSRAIRKLAMAAAVSVAALPMLVQAFIPSVSDSCGVIDWDWSYETVPNRYTFQGREYDAERGDYHFRNRVYMPEWGLFSGPDMNLAAGPYGEAHGMMSYVFCGNDPWTYADPMGMETVWGRRYEVRVRDGIPEVQVNVGRIWDDLVWQGASPDDLGWFFAQTEQGTWRVATDREIQNRWNRRAPAILDESFKSLANTFNEETTDQISKVGTVVVASPVVVIGAVEASPLVAAGYQKACIYTYVKGAYHLRRIAAPVAAAWKWIKGRLGRGESPTVAQDSGQMVHVGERVTVQVGQFVNRVFDSRAGQAGANVSGPLGRSFSPGSGVPTTASEAIQQRGLNLFYPNNAQEAIIMRARENIPAVQRISIGGATPELLIEPQYWNRLETVWRFSLPSGTP